MMSKSEADKTTAVLISLTNLLPHQSECEFLESSPLLSHGAHFTFSRDGNLSSIRPPLQALLLPVPFFQKTLSISVSLL